MDRARRRSPCTIVDISLGGALHVRFRFIGLERWQNFGQGFPIVFATGKALRRALTVRLFGGAYRGTIDEIDIPRVLFTLGKQLLR